MAGNTDVLKFILDFEAKGADTYLKLAGKSKNALAKKLFYSLAAEEVQHARKADEFYSGAVSVTGTSPVETEPLEQVMKGFFEKMAKASFGAGREQLEGYELAMELEREGYKAYENFQKNSRTEDEKAFFKWILGEEAEHLSAIANVYSYLTGTGDWLQGDELRTWNWMNL